MRYKLLIILLLGCSIDFGPDEILKVKYDLCYDEVGILIMEFIDNCFNALYNVFLFLLDEIVYPTVDVVNWNLINIHQYFRHNLYIWLLFFKHSVYYQHSDCGVRSHYHYRRVFFVRTVAAAGWVTIVLMFACILNTSCLVPHGKLSFIYLEFSVKFDILVVNP